MPTQLQWTVTSKIFCCHQLSAKCFEQPPKEEYYQGTIRNSGQNHMPVSTSVWKILTRVAFSVKSIERSWMEFYTALEPKQQVKILI